MHRNWHQSRPPHLLNLWGDLLASLLTITAVVMVVAVAATAIAPLVGLDIPSITVVGHEASASHDELARP